MSLRERLREGTLGVRGGLPEGTVIEERERFVAIAHHEQLDVVVEVRPSPWRTELGADTRAPAHSSPSTDARESSIASNGSARTSSSTVALSASR